MEIEKSQPNNTPWIEKYRPSSLSELVSHENILSTLMRFVNEDSLPNLLFYGPPGTGKTSTIIALARQMYKDEYSKLVLELNASDDRGIDVVRQQIKVFADSMALTMSLNKSLKMVILDEADMMTAAAQSALRRIIEKSEKHVRFCFISNYAEKIIPALQSRCIRFKFKRIPFELALPRIRDICRRENIDIGEEAVKAAFNMCEGDMRRVVNMLQSLSLSLTLDRRELTARDVYEITGNPSPERMKSILEILLTKNPAEALATVSELQATEGIALETIIRSLYSQLLDIETPHYTKAFLVSRLGDVEYRMSKGCDERLQLASIVGAFYESRVVSR